MTFDTQTVTLLAILVAVLGSAFQVNWRMSRLEVSLTERMARLEGLFEGFTKREGAR